MNYDKEVSEHIVNKQKLEKQILIELSNKERGELLDNQELLNLLDESEKTQNTIRKIEQSAKVTKKRFEELKKIFDKVSEKVSHLFFVIDRLWLLNPLYVYSLDWYRELFVSNVKKLQKEKDKIESEFKESLLESISLSIFEKDKLIVSLLICLKIMELDKYIEPQLS
jgi:dynein heavy chain